MKGWIEVEAVLDYTPDDWSPFADAFTRSGCASSMQSDEPPSICGHLEMVPRARKAAEALGNRLLDLGARAVNVREIPDQDWSEIWKQHFKPHRIGERIVVVPSWETYDAVPGDLILNLDPGQAFGTGEHPTTRLCIRLMERLDLSAKRVLDLGCGSGILSLAADKLGAGPITSTDIEPSAVEIAERNMRDNGASAEFYAGDGFGAWAGGRTWEVVLSNIISATLMRLAPEVATYVAPGGAWVVSGILESNWPDVLSAAQRAGFTLESKIGEDDWVGACFFRQP